MNHPIYHPDEEARIGWYAADESLRGKLCKIVKLMTPVYGTNRYLVKCGTTRATLLEPTLRKQFERSDWGMLKTIWRPDRTRKISRPLGWKEFK